MHSWFFSPMLLQKRTPFLPMFVNLSPEWWYREEQTQCQLLNLGHSGFWLRWLLKQSIGMSREKEREKSSELVLMMERLRRRDKRRCTGLNSATFSSLPRYPQQPWLLEFVKETISRTHRLLSVPQHVGLKGCKGNIWHSFRMCTKQSKGIKGIIGIHC